MPDWRIAGTDDRAHGRMFRGRDWSATRLFPCRPEPPPTRPA